MGAQNAEYVLTDEERQMLLCGLGWAVSEGALASEDVVDLAVKLGRTREDWYDTYGPWGLVCGFCGQEPEVHGDSDAGPMSVCPARNDGDGGDTNAAE